MTSQPIPTAALKNGKLEFAIVVTFDSATMTGTVRVVDGGKILPFAYTDGRYTRRENNGTLCYNEVDTPASGFRGLPHPAKGYPIMVDPGDDRISGWTWPGMVIGDGYGVNDQRYLVAPDYGRKVQFPNLHCVVDLTGLALDEVGELLDPDPEFGSPALYVGHHTDDFLDDTPNLPATYAVFAWDVSLGMTSLVDLVNRTV